MRVENFVEFKKDVFDYLKRMHIDDISVVCKCIYKLVSKYDRLQIESVLMDKLNVLLEDKTNEAVEVVCSFLKIQRNYESDVIEDVTKNMHFLNSQNGILAQMSGSRLDINSNRQLAARTDVMNWADIARYAQAEGQRKLNIPCADLLESGVCLKADSCCFTHKDCTVIKSRVNKFTSAYKTVKEKADYRSCILPPQNGYYDDIKVLPGAHQDDAISVSSNENNSHHIDLTNIPGIYEPPTMLDSPLWYQEMGLVEEDTDSDLNSQRQRLHRHRSLIVSNIPSDLNRIGALNKYFRKFGALRNIQVMFKNDSSRALVEFRLAKDMTAAATSSEAVFGNRFIKTKPYKSKKKKKDRRCRSRRRRSSSSERRSDSNRSRSCSSRRNIDCGEKFEKRRRKSVESDGYRNYRRRRLSSIEFKNRSRSPSSNYRNNGKERSGFEDDNLDIVIIKEEARIEQSVVVEQVLANGDGANCGKETNVAMEEELEDNTQAVICKIPYRPKDTRTVIEYSNVSTEDHDLKLEQALNDSDVDSVHSDDLCSQTKRQIVIDSRRKLLQEDTMKNNVKMKISRTADSLNYYKATLESLIVEYHRNDKPGKTRLIAKIKETHTKYMELKQLHASISRSSAADKLRINDPMEGQINHLGSSIEVQLSVNNERPLIGSGQIYVQVPSNIVLDPIHIQAHLGADLKVQNMEKIQSSDTGTCYVITMPSQAATATALHFLSNNNPMNWHIGMEPPAQ